MSSQTGVAFNLNSKNLIVPTAVITATAMVTIGACHVVALQLIPPATKLRDFLNRKAIELENKK